MGKEEDPQAFEAPTKQERERDEGRCNDVPKRDSRAERHRLLEERKSAEKEDKKLG
jgi:hypothetical protein